MSTHAHKKPKNRWNRKINTTRYCAFWNIPTTRYGSQQRTRIIKNRLERPKIGRFSFLGQQKDNRKQNPVIIGTGTYLLFKVASAAQKPSRVLYLDDIIILSEGVIPWYR